jgi:hypothetical protein
MHGGVSVVVLQEDIGARIRQNAERNNAAIDTGNGDCGSKNAKETPKQRSGL